MPGRVLLDETVLAGLLPCGNSSGGASFSRPRDVARLRAALGTALAVAEVAVAVEVVAAVGVVAAVAVGEVVGEAVAVAAAVVEEAAVAAGHP